MCELIKVLARSQVACAILDSAGFLFLFGTADVSLT
jgi:hypothetical protein